MIFIIFSQLQESQRLMMVQNMSMRNLTLEKHAFADVKHWFCNMVDAASGFQVVTHIVNKSSAAIIEAMSTIWFAWAGAPLVCVHDVGPEFYSEDFIDWLESHGVRQRVASVEAPWLNGVCGRIGGLWEAKVFHCVNVHTSSGD